ncbi:MAG: FtsX-like permease family protein [Acidobacteria bacterium]|nr:FtsX-like permease family protein [Acidobacteriota bacterium]
MSNFELGVALRFLRMAGRQAHTAFLSIISILGIAVGVATLIISLATLSGLQNQIRDRLRDTTPHLTIEPAEGGWIDEVDELREALRQWPIVELRPTISGTAWASDVGGMRGRPAMVTSRTSSEIADEEDANRSLTLSPSLASVLGVQTGEEIILVSPRTRLTPFGIQPLFRTYAVESVSMMPANGETPGVMMSFEEASSFFGTEGGPTSIEVRATPELGNEIRDTLEARFPRLRFRSWEDMNRPLFLALRLEKVVMFATISLIVLVAALNLVSSLAMIIVEKKKQVGILSTLGASRRSIGLVFLYLGLFIGLTGTILGDVIGLSFSWAADRWGLVPLPSSVYDATSLPFRIDPADVLGVNAVAIVLAVLTTLYPAWVASSLDPVNAIREE